MNCMLCAAHAAHDRFLAERITFPSGHRMAFAFRMTFVTGIISIAACKFDRNNIFLCMVMDTAGLTVDGPAADHMPPPLGVVYNDESPVCSYRCLFPFIFFIKQRISAISCLCCFKTEWSSCL